MKGKLITTVQYLFFLALGALFVWLSVKDITSADWAHIRYSLQHAKALVDHSCPGNAIVKPLLAGSALEDFNGALRSSPHNF